MGKRKKEEYSLAIVLPNPTLIAGNWFKRHGIRQRILEHNLLGYMGKNELTLFRYISIYIWRYTAFLQRIRSGKVIPMDCVKVYRGKHRDPTDLFGPLPGQSASGSSYGGKSSPEILATRQEWLEKAQKSKEQTTSAATDRNRKKAEKMERERLKRKLREETLARRREGL